MNATTMAGCSERAPSKLWSDDAFVFRAFTLFPGARILLRDDTPVEIGSRAFDLLHVLLRSRGALVERADIVRAVWPTTVVEESNLRVQIAALRKVLGPDRDLLKTVPGRGYLLALDVAKRGASAAGGTTPADTLKNLLASALEELRALGADAPVRTSPPA